MMPNPEPNEGDTVPMMDGGVFNTNPYSGVRLGSIETDVAGQRSQRVSLGDSVRKSAKSTSTGGGHVSGMIPPPPPKVNSSDNVIAGGPARPSVGSVNNLVASSPEDPSSLRVITRNVVERQAPGRGYGLLAKVGTPLNKLRPAKKRTSVPESPSWTVQHPVPMMSGVGKQSYFNSVNAQKTLLMNLPQKGAAHQASGNMPRYSIGADGRARVGSYYT